MTDLNEIWTTQSLQKKKWDDIFIKFWKYSFHDVITDFKKPLKQKFAEIKKQNIDLYWFWAADDENGHIKIAGSIIDR